MSTHFAPQGAETPAPQSAGEAVAPSRRRIRKRWIALGLCAGILGYTLYDLYAPRTSDMRSFDPDEVARLETAMWRSYYGKERVKLFTQLAELLRTQYHLPFLRSNVVAYRAARSAFVFKEGHNRAEYERALPDLVAYYAELRRVSNIPFDVNRAAALELEWWIIHRQRADHPPEDLVRALAELPAEVYHVPVERLMEHARLRAEAMTIRDTEADAGGVTEEDWAKIDELLRASWRELHEAVDSRQ